VYVMDSDGKTLLKLSKKVDAWESTFMYFRSTVW
jgi:hypothetical protein